jgi:hypothetical protein
MMNIIYSALTVGTVFIMKQFSSIQRVEDFLPLSAMPPALRIKHSPEGAIF